MIYSTSQKFSSVVNFILKILMLKKIKIKQNMVYTLDSSK